MGGGGRAAAVPAKGRGAVRGLEFRPTTKRRKAKGKIKTRRGKKAKMEIAFKPGRKLPKSTKFKAGRAMTRAGRKVSTARRAMPA